MGLHVTVAAGNSNMLTSTTSPADCPEAITCGAIDYGNFKAYFSNFGPGLVRNSSILTLDFNIAKMALFL